MRKRGGTSVQSVVYAEGQDSGTALQPPTQVQRYRAQEKKVEQGGACLNTTRGSKSVPNRRLTWRLIALTKAQDKLARTE